MAQTLQETGLTTYMMPGWEEARFEDEGWGAIVRPDVAQPIDGDATGKNLLSMHQLGAEDILDYLREAGAAEVIVQDQHQRGIPLLPFAVMKAVMRQPSTRTGGTMTTAMAKLGGAGELISGMSSSSEAKGESLVDSWLAFAAQADIIGTRTKEPYGPAYAAQSILTSAEMGKLSRVVPIINLGDGKVEHPTQALGDLFTIQRNVARPEDATIVMVGDHERYRAFHSLIIGAVTLGMDVIAVESPVAPVPQTLVDFAGTKLQRTGDLDEALPYANVLYMGRNPDEYDGKDAAELERSRELAAAYDGWVVNDLRLQLMPADGIGLHPRPRRNELHASVDGDPRMRDVSQMELMVSMRMAIIARHMGASIAERRLVVA
jgi:aspartate carbamoyltransferase catalytic subunit